MPALVHAPEHLTNDDNLSNINYKYHVNLHGRLRHFRRDGHVQERLPIRVGCLIPSTKLCTSDIPVLIIILELCQASTLTCTCTLNNIYFTYSISEEIQFIFYLTHKKFMIYF